MSLPHATIAPIRFGYGLAPGRLNPANAGDLFRELTAGAAGDHALGPDLPARIKMLRDAGKAKRANTDPALIDRLNKQNREQILTDIAGHLQRRAFGQGFFERMAAFWGDHFSVTGKSLNRVLFVPVFEAEAIRPHIMGNFADMLVAVSRHPVMLDYLDQRVSIGPNSRAGKRQGKGLNENLAREILELHTMGVGSSYTQTDVRELAELLTGYTYHGESGAFRFVENRAEPGAETVLGQTYGQGQPDPGEAEDALRDIARHPETLRHLARKLAVHFTSDTPDAGLVNHLEAAFREGQGHLPSVYAALLEHPASWESFGQKVKQPIDYLASILRATGWRPDAMAKGPRNQLRYALRIMNQPLWQAPGPDGWPEAGAEWITPQGLAARIEIASKTGQRLARNRDLDPPSFAREVMGDALAPATAFAIGGAEARWEGFALLFASAEFNRR
ncbi:MAG: DUF1800 domain-containing protein [Pseudomonadota bacterium]